MFAPAKNGRTLDIVDAYEIINTQKKHPYFITIF